METVEKRLEMCESLAELEGAELGDAIANLVDSARLLRGIACDYEVQLVLLVAEKLCKEFCEIDYDNGTCVIPDKIYFYFMGTHRECC